MRSFEKSFNYSNNLVDEECLLFDIDPLSTDVSSHEFLAHRFRIIVTASPIVTIVFCVSFSIFNKGSEDITMYHLYHMQPQDSDFFLYFELMHEMTN
jgi:hypothetical protein